MQWFLTWFIYTAEGNQCLRALNRCKPRNLPLLFFGIMLRNAKGKDLHNIGYQCNSLSPKPVQLPPIAALLRNTLL